MPLSEKQKQALQQRTQAKMAGIDPAVIAMQERKQSQAEDAVPDEHVSRETLPEYGSAASEDYVRDEPLDTGGPVPSAPAAHGNTTLEEETSSLDDIPWGGDTSLALAVDAIPQFVEGFRVTGLSLEQIEDASEKLQAYINVKVTHVSEFIGRDLHVIGCVNVPLEGDVVDKQTGAVEYLKWIQPRFMLEQRDSMTGQHIVLYGGGQEAIRLVRFWSALYGPGDLPKHRNVVFTMETRDNGHILYHVSHRRI